jgi:hypothetical protein
MAYSIVCPLVLLEERMHLSEARMPVESGMVASVACFGLCGGRVKALLDGFSEDYVQRRVKIRP